MLADTQAPSATFNSLMHAVQGKAVPPPSSRRREPVTFDDEAGGAAGRRDQISAWVALLTYCDAEGRMSHRLFRCHRLQSVGDGRLNVVGWCYERQAARTFRVDRIVELADAHTGEMYDPARHFDLLRRTGALHHEDRHLTDLTRVLTFMAKCDGAYHPLEREAVTTQLERYVVRFGGDDTTLAAALNGHERLAPDGTDLVRAVKRFSRADDAARLCRFVLDSGAAVIDADGHHHAEEIRWAVEMSGLLKKVCDRTR